MVRQLLSCLVLFCLAGVAVAEDAPSPMLSDAERAHLVELLESSRQELEVMAAEVGKEEWLKRPDPEKWSVGEVVEHLALTEDALFGMIHQALSSEPDPEWQAVAVGTEGVETMVQDRSQKFQAPEGLQPKGESERSATLADYATKRARTLDFVRSIQAPVKQHLAQGPPGKMNVQQWTALIGAHNLRHNRQIQDVIDQLNKK